MNDKQRQEMIETFAYFAAGGKNASEKVKQMPKGALEQSKAEFFDRNHSVSYPNSMAE